MAPNRSGSPSSRHDHHDPPADMMASYGAGGVSLTPIRLWDSSPSYVVVWALGGACVAGKTPQRTCGSRFIRGTARSGHKLEHISPFFSLKTGLVGYRWHRSSVVYWNSRPVHSRRTLRGPDRKLAFPRRREEESEVVREIAQQASGPRREPSETTLKLVQALGPSMLALLGLIIAVITHQ